ncbi:plasmid maintenance protein [Borreliella burgdorferi]|uniref:plasmid maintenance protein n=3 Tax=Borreliella burgdorferi TaxID=139 RepID=UPI0018ECFA0E|nr:plasmid maintenance protein [Borreliella burgdorferi]MDK7384020.1 plasmid maintenance protein [Borreliella burgdorferi]QYM88396.1 hypothetical protein KGA77_07165 [Borreliella burgdorferi]
MHKIKTTNNNPRNCYNKVQYKLIVLISTICYLNKTHKKYTQKTILYYFNENLRKNGQTISTLRTMQKYIYRLQKEIKVTTNYYQHMGVNSGTEIYYKLNYPKKDCYHKINQHFKEKKEERYQNRVANYFNKNSDSKMGSVQCESCNSNKNNIKEERKINEIEKYQVINYFNKCNFSCKEILSILLNLNVDKDTMIKIIKTIKRTDIKAKNKNIYFPKSCSKEKQEKLKKILCNTQKELEKSGYNPEQLETNFQKIYENYKYKPHFIIENHKYSDLSYIKRKLEKSIERKKENSKQDYKNLRTNIFNILIEQLKKETNIEILKPIIKEYLNNQKKIEYKKVFRIYYSELLEIINGKHYSNLKKFRKKSVG